MKPFKIYSTSDANPDSSNVLKAVEQQLGFVPNIFAVIAESTPALKAFAELNAQFAESSFNATSREIIQTATSVENQCSYCVAGHTAFAVAQNVSAEVIEAVRNNQPIDDQKLEALNQFTRLVVQNKGMISEKTVRDFLAAGYTHKQLLEVILGICAKMFSNLANNVIGIPLDEKFADYSWTPKN